MKSLRIHTKKYTYFLIAAALALALAGCEGLDDWSDLKNIDLFDTKSNMASANEFKRYSPPGMSSQPLVEFINDGRSKYCRFYESEIQKACDYTKMPYRDIPLEQWNKTLAISPTTRVLCVYDTQKLSDSSIGKLIDFVANGGTLFIPFANIDPRMAYLYGFKPTAEFGTDTHATGWTFNVPMLPNLKGKNYSAATKFYGFAANNFSKKIKVLATATNDPNFPVIIENTIGSGRVLFYNNSGDFGKADRGLLFAGILKGLEGIPYPIANTSTIFLDDFPSPQYNVMEEPVASELNLSMSDFVTKVWWPDLKKLSKEFKIPYAAMTTFDYRNKIVPPFTLDQWNSEKITENKRTEPVTDWLVKDVAKNGHEVAFHGYNHVSLMRRFWKNPQFITTSMNTVRKKWEISNYGKLPSTYVPPSNDIDKMGLVELKKAMPSLKYICSLYLGNKEDGGNREFDYDPYNKEFFDYPRISSGFYLNDDRKYNVQSVYLMTGIWTHFIHPDDIYQIPEKNATPEDLQDLRNGEGLGWYKTKGKNKAMFPEFRKIIRQMTETYPQLRFLTANDAAKVVINWRASRYTHKAENGFYKVKQINPEDNSKQYWFMYGSVANADRIETQLKSQKVLFSRTSFIDGYLYSVYSSKTQLTVVDVNYKGPKERAKQLAVNQLVKADLMSFNDLARKFRTGDIWVDDSDKKLKMAMAALKDKLINTPEIDSVRWDKYAKYMSWDDKGKDVWKMLEEHVAKYPSKNNVLYSQQLDKVIGYTDDDMKEQWMTKQIAVNPTDKDLLNSYVANFYTDDNQEKIKNVLKKLVTVDPSKKSYMNYIKHLLQFYPDEARTELEDVKPTADYAELATPIVWLFADNSEYNKALEWAALSKEIDFVTIMNWYIASGQSKAIEAEYLKYIAEHPEDLVATILMSNIYHEQGRFKDAWILANSLPDMPEKEELRKTFNRDVVFEEDELQQDLIANHAALFYPEVMKKLIKKNRLAKGNFIDVKSSLETNQKDTSVQKNILSYNFYDKKNHLHSVAATYSQFYALDIPNKAYDDNFKNSLMGIQYKYSTAIRDGKPNYWTRARVEVNKQSNLYYQFGIGVNQAKEKTYRSAELKVFPVETAPGINQKIYQAQLNLYQDFYLFKKINTSVSFEGNYYTDGMLSKDTITIINPNRGVLNRKKFVTLDDGTTEVTTLDNALNGSLSLRMMLDNGEIKKSKFIPFLETQGSIGSRNLTVGYPYWMINNRFYGGGGLAWEFLNGNFHSKVEGGYFLDDYSGNFQRLSGNMSYQLFDFTELTLALEIFEESKFYSNSIQLGVKYNLKKKYKRKK